MNWVATIILLAVAFLAVYFEASFNELRRLIGVQIDLLPSLMVYAGLSHGLGMVALLAVCGGLWFDALSANPLGVSVLPPLTQNQIRGERIGLVAFAGVAEVRCPAGEDLPAGAW